MRVIRLFALLGLASGCAVHVREATALQPNPVQKQSPDVLPVSAKLFIYQRDMNLPRTYELRSSAQFAVVSKDRLRFHVTIVRFDEDEADVANWTAYMEDETGHRYPVSSREGPKRNRLAIRWDLYPFNPQDPWCREPPCYAKIEPGYDVYQGVADLVFHAPHIMGDARKAITLVLRNGTLEYRYSWKFGWEYQVNHYGRTKVDDELGIISVPGPNIQVAGSEDEEEWTAAAR